jgi:hypothetical protein
MAGDGEALGVPCRGEEGGGGGDLKMIEGVRRIWPGSRAGLARPALLEEEEGRDKERERKGNGRWGGDKAVATVVTEWARRRAVA